MKTLLIDGQLFQTNAFYRGMGGFTHNLMKAYSLAHPDVQIIVILNTNMLHSEERMQAIQKRLPTATLHLLDLPFQPQPGPGEEARAVEVLDAFIAEHIAADDQGEVYYFIPALFLFDYCAVFPTHAKKLLLFHDLTPLIFRKDMAKYFPAHLYFPRFKTIFEADIVFANSQTTALDLQLYLGLDPAKLVTIDGSLTMRKRAKSDESHPADAVLERLGLRDTTYMLMPTGGTEFKNNIRAALALNNLKRTLSVDLKVVATSFFRDHEKAELRLVAGDDILFSGNITNDEMTVLFEHCKAVLLPSLYEGLGLPVLEGVEHNKPVACSRIPVFQEIPRCEDALYMFDPYDTEDIAEAMLRAVSHAGFDQKRQHYPEVLQKYRWERSADIFAKALQTDAHYAPRTLPDVRIAVTCPDPRKNNDVAVFAQRMYGYGLQYGIEFVYFIDPGGDDDVTAEVLPDYIRSLALSYDIESIYEKLREDHFDGVLHFMSSDTRFVHLVRAALSIPGQVYIGNKGYHETIKILKERNMISDSQAAVEDRLYDKAHAKQAFETVSIIAGAQGIIVEKHIRRLLTKALHLFELDAPPTLEVPECSVVNFDAHAVNLQPKVYAQVFSLITGKKQ